MITHQKRTLIGDQVQSQGKAISCNVMQAQDMVKHAIDKAIEFGGWIGIDARPDESKYPMDIQYRERGNLMAPTISCLFNGPEKELKALKLFAIIYKARKNIRDY